MIGETDAVLLLPESYDLPDVGFSEVLTLDKPKTGKTLTQYEVDLLKKLLPKVGRSFENVKVNPNFYTIKDTTKVIESMFGDHPTSPLIMAILPDQLERIEDEAFADMENLVYIRIPDNVKHIGEDAFIGCYFIKENFVNNSKLDAEANDYWGACIVDEEIDGMLLIVYNKGYKIVVNTRRYLFDSVTIPNGVTHIGEQAFHSRSSITSITIPNSVRWIGDEAFSECDGLTSITIPNSVTSIGNNTFYNCSSLTSITIPNSVTSIGEWAFAGCSSLTSITIPSSVTSIGDEAFAGCENLTDIICQSIILPTIAENSIDNSYNPTIYVPQAAVAAYQADAEWGKLNIQAISQNVI